MNLFTRPSIFTDIENKLTGTKGEEEGGIRSLELNKDQILELKRYTQYYIKQIETRSYFIAQEATFNIL